MNKNLLSIIIAVVLTVAGGLLIINYNKAPKIDINGIVLFYGDGCPHCKIVDDFVKANNIETKVKFIRLEVFNNKDNAKVLSERAQACGLLTDQIGVPFLWNGKTCIVGDQDVIKFFQEKVK